MASRVKRLFCYLTLTLHHPLMLVCAFALCASTPRRNSLNVIFVYRFQLIGERHQHQQFGWGGRLGGATEKRGADYRFVIKRG